jgi:peptidoglycan/LPS O-acetylase OafA/YrhL
VEPAVQSEPTRGARAGRIVFLDGMRGIASMLVVIFHVLLGPLSRVSAPAGALAQYGFHGVTIFFVVSGFAISQSLAGVWITPPTAGRFLLRRICRLDPPYWASLVLVFAVVAASRTFLHQPQAEINIGASGVVAHVFYLQDFLGVPCLQNVYWTLAFEIQFYLLLVAMLAAHQRLARWGDTLAFVLVFAGPLAYSLLATRGLTPTPRGACFQYWYIFFIGVAAQRLVARGDWRVFGAVLLAVAAGAWRGGIAQIAIGFALLLALGHHRNKLGVWLSGRGWQLLGRISYSLYLVHAIVAERMWNLLNRVLKPSPAMQVLTALACMGVAVVAAQAFWWLIERPSLALSRRISVRAATTPAMATATAALAAPPAAR